MIRFQCPACQKKLKAPGNAVGRKVDCPGCGQRLQVPQPAPLAARQPNAKHAAARRVPATNQKPLCFCSGCGQAVTDNDLLPGIAWWEQDSGDPATKRAKCPRCGVVFDVAAASSAPAPTRPTANLGIDLSGLVSAGPSAFPGDDPRGRFAGWFRRVRRGRGGLGDRSGAMLLGV
jgi:DNA-directed RNA polymerase subunit RPC12/RpoP